MLIVMMGTVQPAFYRLLSFKKRLIYADFPSFKSVKVLLHLWVLFEGVNFHKCFGLLFGIFDTFEHVTDLLV